MILFFCCDALECSILILSFNATKGSVTCCGTVIPNVSAARNWNSLGIWHDTTD